MGHWDDDPFGNDTALVWLLLFREAAPARRNGMLREVLASATVGTDVYLDTDYAYEAIAAAAVIAGEPSTGDADLPGLAVAALDRIGGTNSEWRDLQGEYGPGILRRLRELVLKAQGQDSVRVSTPSVGAGDEAGPFKYLTYTKQGSIDANGGARR